MAEVKVTLPRGVEERMEILIGMGLYDSKEELINDALRRLIEREFLVLTASHRYYWERLKSESDVDVSEDELEALIHEIREKGIA